MTRGANHGGSKSARHDISKSSRLVVFATIFASDVFEGASAADLRELHDRIGHLIPYVPDDHAALALRLARGLLAGREDDLEEAFELSPGALATWLDPYIRLGVKKRWLAMLPRLRAQNVPGFARIHELAHEAVDVDWVFNGVFERPSEIGDSAIQVTTSPPLYVLPLDLTVPRELQKTEPLSAPSSIAVRPFPADAEDERAVEALASALRPAIEAMLGGPARLRNEPILAPLCVLAATVLTALSCELFRGRHRIKWCSREGLRVCIHGLGLAAHLETSERILLRNHPRHIHVDASRTTFGYASDDWRDGLGIFAAAADGHLVRVTRLNRDDYRPRILRCLSAPEPL
jgi:hypothetical protein